MADKVFCGECEHYNVDRIRARCLDPALKTIKDTPIERDAEVWDEFRWSPHGRNKRNNCRGFTPKTVSLVLCVLMGTLLCVATVLTTV